MGALSFFSISSPANYTISRLPFPYPPARFSQWQSRTTKYHVLTKSTGSSNYEFTYGRRSNEDLESTSPFLIEDISKLVQEKKNKTQSPSTSMYMEDDITTIRRLFSKIERRHTSISAYDTAWVAMVPSLENYQLPQFPQCLSWIMENQLKDGSWGLLDLHYIKDQLSHTLACLIALRTWNVGNKNVEMGLRFITENIGKIESDDTYKPIGFDLIFTAMLEDARGLCLELPYDSPPIELMFTKREEILKSIGIDNMNEYDPHLIFIVEGIRTIVDWTKVLRHENMDGSLFHSPSATACALIHTGKSSCFKYLNSMLENLRDGVPSLYPINFFSGLLMVDRLERLGIERHFKYEIKKVLDDVYRCWTKNEIIEGISSVSDIIKTSVSFRILRWNGYDVSPDAFINYLKEGNLLASLGKSSQAVTAMLALYQASQLMFPGERILEEAKSSSKNYLVKSKAIIAMADKNKVYKDLAKEVEYVLDVPWVASLERIEQRRYIETYGFDNIHLGKTSYRIPYIGHDYFLSLAKEDYNVCQAIHQKDLQELEKWYAESKLGNLEFSRKKLLYCYFSIASTLFIPEMSTLRIVWTKNAVLTVVMDDFYDVAGSIEEHQCFLEAVKRWDPAGIYSSSDSVKILFFALYNTVNDIAQDASACQGWDVSIHFKEIWYRLANSAMKEAEWAKTRYIPSMQEYLQNGEISFALEPMVLISIYFVGPKISEQTICHHEYNLLIQLLSNCGRLLNDIQSYKREIEQGKHNYVSLLMKEYPETSFERATECIRQTIHVNTQTLLRNLLQSSVLPRDCKQVYWAMLQNVQLFYQKTDGFSSASEMLEHINAVIFNPVI